MPEHKRDMHLKRQLVVWLPFPPLLTLTAAVYSCNESLRYSGCMIVKLSTNGNDIPYVYGAKGTSSAPNSLLTTTIWFAGVCPTCHPSPRCDELWATMLLPLPQDPTSPADGRISSVRNKHMDSGPFGRTLRFFLFLNPSTNSMVAEKPKGIQLLFQGIRRKSKLFVFCD